MRILTHPVTKVFAALGLLVLIALGVVFNHYWWKFAPTVDAKLTGKVFNRTSRILAAPDPVFVEDTFPRAELISQLREAGYSDAAGNQIGHFEVLDDTVVVRPGPRSYFRQEPVSFRFEADQVVEILAVNDQQQLEGYDLEPELITNLFDSERSKQRLLRYEEIPEHLRHAVIAIEDHRFFSHFGIDVLRTGKAAWDGYTQGKLPRGTSTITQQLARGFFLTIEQNYQRKFEEAMIALQLESRLTKEEIFEYYCNQAQFGRVGSFNVVGVGEAAQAYFDKNVREITLPEAALLAGMLQGASYLNPYRHPERAKTRRNVVLGTMLREEFITEEEFQQAKESDIVLAQGHIESSDAPYFVDLVNTRLREKFTEEDLITQQYAVYTTLDMDLQRIAVDAVRIGLEEVNDRLSKQRRFKDQEIPYVQAALVALDPSTGEIKAIVGGRDYGRSQLNRVLAERQPGSTFKPFVYAAALETGLDPEAPETLTPISTVDDVPTTFWYDDQAYEPANFGNRIYGMVTLREALYKSINIATVKVAELAGYERVAELGLRVGMGKHVKPTPSVALGSYEATPLEIAAAYTALVNDGERMEPYFIRSVKDSDGKVLLVNQPQRERVLDERIAFLTKHMLQDVVNRGTAYRVRREGFEAPAAGKTGTDDDGWFAGFTNNLVCVVWVGFDDNLDLKVEGSKSALPIWVEFMKRAHELRHYSEPEPFKMVEGIVTVPVDPITGEVATYACTERKTEVFLDGTQPRRFCSLHSGMLSSNSAGWRTAPEDGKALPIDSPGQQIRPVQPRVDGLPVAAGRPAVPPPPTPEPVAEEADPKKKSIFGRILNAFKKKDDN